MNPHHRSQKTSLIEHTLYQFLGSKSRLFCKISVQIAAALLREDRMNRRCCDISHWQAFETCSIWVFDLGRTFQLVKP